MNRPGDIGLAKHTAPTHFVIVTVASPIIAKVAARIHLPMMLPTSRSDPLLSNIIVKATLSPARGPRNAHPSHQPAAHLCGRLRESNNPSKPAAVMIPNATKSLSVELYVVLKPVGPLFRKPDERRNQHVPPERARPEGRAASKSLTGYSEQQQLQGVQMPALQL